MPFQEESLKEGSGQNGNMVAIAADAQRCISRLREEFETKMSDDLNTSPLLTGAFQEALKLINSSLGMLIALCICSFVCIYGDLHALLSLIIARRNNDCH